ncbi:unnamed protein product [Rotaria sordida]|uniref:Uncharacterized protein n=1 Tax=Rotaria sordida TaxID=392033 RepID=A0A818ZIQ9_9BILA|nr:unnamed protein product [Rotaria sordida]
MRTHLKITLFVLFICAVSSKPISSSSDEEDSNDIRRGTNLGDLDEILPLSRRRYLTNDDSDDEITDIQLAEARNESDEPKNVNNYDGNEKIDTQPVETESESDESKNGNNNDEKENDPVEEIQQPYQKKEDYDNLNNINERVETDQALRYKQIVDQLNDEDNGESKNTNSDSQSDENTE